MWIILLKIELSTENGVFYQHYTQLKTQKAKKKLTNNQQNQVIHKLHNEKI